MKDYDEIQTISGPIAPIRAGAAGDTSQPHRMTYSVYLGRGGVITSPERFPDVASRTVERRDASAPVPLRPPCDDKGT